MLDKDFIFRSKQPSLSCRPVVESRARRKFQSHEQGSKCELERSAGQPEAQPCSAELVCEKGILCSLYIPGLFLTSGSQLIRAFPLFFTAQEADSGLFPLLIRNRGSKILWEPPAWGSLAPGTSTGNGSKLTKRRGEKKPENWLKGWNISQSLSGSLKYY